MEFLTKLLAVDVPENTALQSAELSFRGLMAWWLAAAFIGFLMLGVVYLYALERGTMGWPRRILMIGLRTALIALVLLLMFRPVLLAEFRGDRPRQIVLLVDNSQSMKQQDRRLTDVDRLRVAYAKNLIPLDVFKEYREAQAKIQEQPTGTPIDLYELVMAKLTKPPKDIPNDPPRADLVDWILQHKDLNLLEKLEKDGPLRLFLFGQTLHGVDPRPVRDKAKETSAGVKDLTEQLLSALTASESRTALTDSVMEILGRKGGDLPAAIVIVSDGQDNASKFTYQEVGLECARVGVPLYIYGVGTAEGGSLQLKEMAAAETIFVDDTLVVPLRWRAQGFKKGTLEMTLTMGGKIVAHKEVPIQTGADLRDYLSFTVEKGKAPEETHDLVASIRLKGSDIFKDKLARPVRVVDRKIKILYIENAPRFEFKFLQPTLLRDRRLDAHFLLLQADPKIAFGGPPFIPNLPATRDKFFEAKYNLIILGDVPAGYLGKEHMEWIREHVQKRGGLIVMAGRQHMPSRYEGTPLAEVLPIEFKPVKGPIEADVRTQEYPPTLTEVGQRTDWLALADTPEENLKLWHGLPGFHWNYPITKLRPAAVPLVVNPRAKMGEYPMPIAAMQYYGKGQVLFLATDETWRWRYNVQDKYFARFWGQVIYQFGLGHMLGDAAQRVQMALERSEAILDRPGSVFVRLFDKDFNPRKDAQVEATLEYLDAKPGQERTRKITLQGLKGVGREGEYWALLPHDKPGRWEIRVNNPEPSAFSFRVDLPLGHELEETGLAEKNLRDMAELSGGKFYHEEDLARLPEDVTMRKASFTQRQEVMLWNPLALLLFVMLITAEWLVRKFSNLS